MSAWKQVIAVGIGMGVASVAGAAAINIDHISPQNTAATFTTVGAASWQIGASASTFANSIYAVTTGDNNNAAGNFKYQTDDNDSSVLTRVDIGANENGMTGALILKFSTDTGLQFTGGTITVAGSGFDGSGTNAGGLNVRVQTGVGVTLDSNVVNGFSWIGSPTDTKGRTYGGTPFADHTDSYTVSIPSNVSTFYLAIEDNGQGVTGSTFNHDFYLGRNVPMASSISLNATVGQVPEPAAIGLLALGGIMLMRRRHRAVQSD